MSMGGGGGGGSNFARNLGPAPEFKYLSPQALQKMAVGGDMASYALSDQDFARRYPALQDAYTNYQAQLGQQVGRVGAGAQGQADIMSQLQGMIGGRTAADTSDIQSIRQAGQMGLPIFNLGQSQAGLAQPLIGMGQQQAGIGANITGAGQELMGRAQIPYQLGQQLLNAPIDPQVQQQMMRAGLGTSAGALGAASLGQGMAGQAAAARQLGLNTMQYGQQRRAEAMGDINQYASMLGAGGQMQGLGAQTIGAGGQTIGLGGQQMAQGAGTMAAGGQLLGGMGQAAQSAVEQRAMDTAQMAQIYGGLQGQQAQNLLGSIANAGQQFARRPFGLGGTNMAQAELGQAAAYNSFQQANYATAAGIAYNQAQMNAQQSQLQAQQGASMMGTGVSVGTTAAVTGATVAAMSCWVAAAVYGEGSRNWRIFRHWLLNKAPRIVRVNYLRYGQGFAPKVRQNRLLRTAMRLLMDPIIKRTVYVGY